MFTVKLRNYEDNSVKAEHSLYFLPFHKYKILIDEMAKINEVVEDKETTSLSENGEPEKRYKYKFDIDKRIDITAQAICMLFNERFTKGELIASVDYRDIIDMPLKILEETGQIATGDQKNGETESKSLSEN
jgi:hypothetical protein